MRKTGLNTWIADLGPIESWDYEVDKRHSDTLAEFFKRLSKQRNEWRKNLFPKRS